MDNQLAPGVEECLFNQGHVYVHVFYTQQIAEPEDAVQSCHE